MLSKLIVKRREPESKQSRVSLVTKLKTSLQCKPCKGKKNIQCILCQVSVNSLVGETEKKNTQIYFFKSKELNRLLHRRFPLIRATLSKLHDHPKNGCKGDNEL